MYIKQKKRKARELLLSIDLKASQVVCRSGSTLSMFFFVLPSDYTVGLVVFSSLYMFKGWQSLPHSSVEQFQKNSEYYRTVLRR